MLHRVLILGVSLCGLNPVQAGSWLVQDLPDPKSSPKACGQSSPSRVCDPENYLDNSPAVQKALNVLESDYSYPGCGGYEMAVVVVSRIANGGDEESTERFAKGVIDQWGVGKPECNNGIALVLAVVDRQMFIATGRGAKEKLADKELQQIIERMKTPLRNSDVAGAVEQCVSDIAQVLAGTSFVPGWFSFDTLFLPFFVCCFLVMTLYGWKTKRRYNACKRKLTLIEKEHAERKAAAYKSESCPICLELFKETKNLEQELLVCGHTFHKSCLGSWEDRHNTCPVCRHPTGASLTPQYVGGVAQSHSDDYHFRLARVRHYYPDYVSNDMVHRWTSPNHDGQLVADTAFVRNSPSYNSGGSGSSSSSSFSGGCSSGGGGAGGSW